MENASCPILTGTHYSKGSPFQKAAAPDQKPEKISTHRDPIRKLAEPTARIGVVRTSSEKKNLSASTRRYQETNKDFKLSPQEGHSRHNRGSSKDAPRIHDFSPPPPHRLPEDILVQATLLPARSPDTSRLRETQMKPETDPTACAPLLDNPRLSIAPRLGDAFCKDVSRYSGSIETKRAGASASSIIQTHK